ncbi:hypothetical protein H4R34_004432 [Dimargaris verticillata]|uniref:Uncharacterized protein n=1 Tax=Dimargaris verticillata TaxID=2761393 RepID=A0A9W8AYV2_9FUNG|nr:hypothetical protein H4R34_004432 [Dimargaris verticillata]
MKFATAAALFAVLAATAVSAQSSGSNSELFALADNLSDEQKNCLQKAGSSSSVNDKLLEECLGIDMDTVNKAVDCVKECPQPKSLDDTEDFMKCATKCYEAIADKITKDGKDGKDSKASSSSSDNSGAETTAVSMLAIPVALFALFGQQ